MKKNFNSKKVFRPSPKKKVRSMRKKQSLTGRLKSFIPQKPFAFQKKEVKKTKKTQPSIEGEMKVFKPKKDYFIKSKIKDSVNPLSRSKKKNPFNRGNKKLSELTKKVSSFSLRDLPKTIKYQILKYRIADRFNRIMSYTVLSILFIFVIYISFFDTFFLVKTYSINFVDGSYIDDYETNKLIESIHRDKFLGLIPNNSLWFLNSSNLTFSSQKFNRNIKSVRVADRVWPNQASLDIDIEPILLTLGINDSEYWRVGKNGDITSQDNAGIREKLVIVDKPIIFDKSGITFRDFTFENQSQQLNRFYFINWLWDLFEQENIGISKTVIPSIIDTDVMIYTTSGTKIMFDLEATDKPNQKVRFTELFKDDFKAEESQGVINYIDFRIPKRIFICRNGESCSSE